MTMVRYLGQADAINLDIELFNDFKFTVVQLMELAGLACAHALASEFPAASLIPQRPVLVVVGPGNNGGDGLVMARHLHLLGYTAHIFYPKRTDQELFSDLVHQAKEADVIFLDSLPEDISSQYSLVVDAIFGFSFKPPVRPLFMPILESLTRVSIPLISVDIPSGWDVEAGPPEVSVATPVLRPDMLVSLTAPKLGSRGFSGAHYLGGRFVPRKLAVKYNLNLPEYPETDLVVKLKDKEHKEL